MASQQLKLAGTNGKTKRPRAPAADIAELQWLAHQSTGQLVILLSDIATILHRRGLMLTFQVEPPRGKEVGR